MQIRTTMLALGITLGALAAAPAFAAGAAQATTHKTMTAQQQKMATCSHESKGMKGDAHKKFMSDCLHGKTMAAAPEKTAAAAPATSAKAEKTDARAAQREKMKTCNADAKTKSLKGAARKSFMSTCLKAA